MMAWQMTRHEARQRIRRWLALGLCRRLDDGTVEHATWHWSSRQLFVMAVEAMGGELVGERIEERPAGRPGPRRRYISHARLEVAP